MDEREDFALDGGVFVLAGDRWGHGVAPWLTSRLRLSL